MHMSPATTHHIQEREALASRFHPAGDISLMLCFLLQVWPLRLDRLSGAANLSPRPACSDEDAVHWS